MSPQAAPFLPYGRQDVDEDDIAAVARVLRGNWLTTGPAVESFEAALAETCGAGQAVVCANGTAALHLAVLAAGLKPGDKAIVPAVTFLATANAVHYVGAEVVFADCDPTSGLMEASHFAEALERAGPGVKAVLPVHLGGQCADLPAIGALAKRQGITMIEDAAHAIGSLYRRGGNQDLPIGCGADGDMACFSFHPVKTMTMGEGGAITTNDPQLAERLRRLRSHGMSREPGDFENADLAWMRDGTPNEWYYEMAEPGFNYRATDFQCALGLSQLGKLSGFVERRRHLVARYDSLLKPLAPQVRAISRNADCTPAWHLYVVLIDFAGLGLERGQVMQRLRAVGIGTQVHYIPVHQQPFYRRQNGGLGLPGAERYYAQALSLPLFPGMNDADVDRVVNALHDALNA
jgi:UDP-4-amino-4,6-dideoxy-N-acetyl-beta-L-altrosamine transaminase